MQKYYWCRILAFVSDRVSKVLYIIVLIIDTINVTITTTDRIYHFDVIHWNLMLSIDDN